MLVKAAVWVVLVNDEHLASVPTVNVVRDKHINVITIHALCTTEVAVGVVHLAFPFLTVGILASTHAAFRVLNGNVECTNLHMTLLIVACLLLSVGRVLVGLGFCCGNSIRERSFRRRSFSFGYITFFILDVMGVQQLIVVVLHWGKSGISSIFGCLNVLLRLLCNGFVLVIEECIVSVMGYAQAVVHHLPRIVEVDKFLYLLVCHNIKKTHVACCVFEELAHERHLLIVRHCRCASFFLSWSLLCRSFLYSVVVFLASFAAIVDNTSFCHALCFTLFDGFLSCFLLFFFCSIV